MKTQVLIIGVGPAGLLLGHLLQADRVDSVVVERAPGDQAQNLFKPPRSPAAEA